MVLLLPFQDNTFDAVVSFETIEHTTEYMKMVSEFSRVIKQGGIVYISTPNFPINSPTGVVTNPYHTQEFNLEEFEDILKSSFGYYEIQGQKYVRYDQAKGISSKIAKTAEAIMYQRGVRKIPVPVQDAIMRTINSTPMYPTSQDYCMTAETNEIILCKTLFATCQK